MGGGAGGRCVASGGFGLFGVSYFVVVEAAVLICVEVVELLVRELGNGDGCFGLVEVVVVVVVEFGLVVCEGVGYLG